MRRRVSSYAQEEINQEARSNRSSAEFVGFMENTKRYGFTPSAT